MIMRILACAISVVPLAAMSADRPGSLVRGEAADSGGSWALTAQQLASADSWIQSHRLNCLAGLGSPPAPNIRVRLYRSDGSDLSLGFYSQPGYSAVVETRVGKNLCHFKGSETEVASLRAALSRSN